MSSSDAADEFKDDFDLSDLGLATKGKPESSAHADDPTDKKDTASTVQDDSDEEILDLALVGEFLGVASDPLSEQTKTPNKTSLDPFAQKDASLVHLSPTDFVPEEHDASDAKMVEDSVNQKADALLFDFENVTLDVDDADMEIFTKESQIFKDEISTFSSPGDKNPDSPGTMPHTRSKEKKQSSPPKTSEEKPQKSKEEFSTLEADLDDALDFLDEEDAPGQAAEKPARREVHLEDSLDFLDEDEDEDIAPPEKKAPEKEEEMELGSALDFLDEEDDPGQAAEKPARREVNLEDSLDFLDEDENIPPPAEKPAKGEVNLEDSLDFLDEDEEFPDYKSSSHAPQDKAPEKKSPPAPQKETGGFYPVSEEEDILDIDDIIAAPVLPQGFQELSGEADVFQEGASSEEPFSDADILDIDDLLLTSDFEIEAEPDEKTLPQSEADTEIIAENTDEMEDLTLPTEDADLDLDEMFSEPAAKSESPSSAEEELDFEDLDGEIDLGDLFGEGKESKASAKEPSPTSLKPDEEMALDDLSLEEFPMDEDDFDLPDAEGDAFELDGLDDEELGTLIIGDAESASLAEEGFEDGSFDLDDMGEMKFSFEEASLPDIKFTKETPREKTEETIQVQDFDSSLDTALNFLFDGEDALDKTDVFPEDGEKPSEPADDAALRTSPADSGLSSLDGLEDEDFLTGLDELDEEPSLASVSKETLPAPEDIADEDDLSAIFDEERPKTPEQKKDSKPKLTQTSSDFGLFSSDDSALDFLSEGDGALAEDDLLASEEYLADIGDDSPDSSREGLPIDRGFGKQQTAEKTQEESSAEAKDLFGEDTFSAEKEAQADEDFDALFDDLEKSDFEEKVLSDSEIEMSLEEGSPEKELSMEDELLDDMDAAFDEDLLPGDELKTESEEESLSDFEAELELEESNTLDGFSTEFEKDFAAEAKALAEAETDPEFELEPRLEMDREDSFLKESGGISAEEARRLAEEAEKLSDVLEGYPDDGILPEDSAPDFSDLDILFDGKPALKVADENIADVVSQVKGEEDFGKVISQVLTPGEARVPSAVERDIVLAVNPPISVSELESMLEKIVRKVLSEKIDAALVAAVEKAVEKEFKALAHSLYDEE
ncbi:hypothetical protein LJC24_04405 [Desulfococcaceae bacterium OttesenSCG-928-F15]|nr:hypothetical protein [Desulfococcaceae bacterium OttesenSCG-928-F15]